MREYEKKLELRTAIDDCLSGVERLPSQRAQILRRATGGTRGRRKLSATAVLALLLAMLSVGALAAAWLSAREIVEQQVVPMAQGNDGAQIKDTFTNAELARVVALAEENGVEIPQRLRDLLARGEGYWEEETIMALAKAQFGPLPGRWSLEEQRWFEEMMVAIGFKAYNVCRIPGEGDLTLEQALDMARNYLAAQYGADASLLADPQAYALTKTYEVQQNDDGSVTDPAWYFWFEPMSLLYDEFIVTMDHRGNVTDVQARMGRAQDYDAVNSHYDSTYGPEHTWAPEVWVAYGRDMQQVGDEFAPARAFKRTAYILPPPGAISREEAIKRAVDAIGPRDWIQTGACCYESGGRAVWKAALIAVNEEGFGETTTVELDAMTGEILSTYVMDLYLDRWFLRYVPSEVYHDVVNEPEPEGLG